MVIVIGRGHSGTRVISQFLKKNGYRTGLLNGCYDMIPAEEIYCSAKIFSDTVKVKSPYSWNFKDTNPPTVIQRLIKSYLKDLLLSDQPSYFKLPETTLCYPWIVKMFPNAKYINWVRDPRDFGIHLSDNFSRWHIKVPDDWITNYTKRGVSKDRINAAISCKYQFDIVESTKRPKNFLRMRYEDFCQDQYSEIERLKGFLGKSTLAPVEVSRKSIGKWRYDPDHIKLDFLDSMIKSCGY